MDKSTTNTSSLYISASQVVFGHCISNYGGDGSNISAAKVVQVTSNLKAYNGGAFLWVALYNIGGAWSYVCADRLYLHEYTDLLQ